MARILPSFEVPSSDPQLEGLVTLRRVWQRAYTAGRCKYAVTQLRCAHDASARVICLSQDQSPSRWIPAGIQRTDEQAERRCSGTLMSSADAQGWRR